ncbi:DUF397 domain-containing protein [Kitasatospora purpeofusca]|uniref:DUF397 domain-containing protein n=1 Tax=Kitasatospora purpeofusca TaxID=67352 RepID=A0ABZ1U0N8_9ACTN|nr:DUF397 domain-containing protein [Kitasatospora purpeofusca]
MTNDTWQKSSRSGSHDDCVEVRTSEALIELRESDDGENILRATPTAVAALLRAIKTGELDHHA